MGLDQIHEENNKLIKMCGEESDLLNKVDNSVLIRWETSSPEKTRVIFEFKDCLDRNEILVVSSNKHHEDFTYIFTKDFLPKLLGWLNALQWIHLCKITSLNLTTKNSLYQRLLRTVIDDLEAIGEKKLETFVSDQLFVSKVPISQKKHLKQNKNMGSYWYRTAEM